jgi:glutamate dehydrogenase/leucine dehydrogenase
MLSDFRFLDETGPAKVVQIHEPAVGLMAFVVIDNVAAGPAIGGLRMAPDVSAEECFRLARAMTFKNAVAGLPHGGGKSVLVGDPGMADAEKERLIRAFAGAARDLKDYIVGPDMGTNERCMAWVHDEIRRAVGLPAVLGGIPLDEIGATGFGLATAIDVAQEFCDIRLDGARVAVQGFGAVGKHAARFLAEKGAVLVAASDSHSMVANADGLDVQALIDHKAGGESLASFPGGSDERDAILDVDCDIWIPAARPDVLTEDNVGRLKARMVAQGANIPATPGAETALHRRGVLVLPDFIANAGGVICASVEYHGGNRTLALQTIEEKLTDNTRAVLQHARDAGSPPRQAALEIAEARVREAMALRRWG